MSVVHDVHNVTQTEKRIRTDAAHLLALDAQPDAMDRWFEQTRFFLDFVCALALLVMTAPIVIMAALAVKLTSRGPVVYSQTRTGKDGQPFTIFKIRTMTHNCESLTGACWSTPSDPRITWVGWWLRRTHIDELPQLWNVLRGEMSLVGPRPERPEFVARLEQALPDYRKRLAMKPGLSGLAQIQLPPDTDLESVRRKLLYDIYYVDRGTLWLDIRIVLCTICKVLHLPLAWPRVLLRMPTAKEVEGATCVDGCEKQLNAPTQVLADDAVVLAGCGTASFSSVS
jgi:lipopolysaccharide/colanic/teichoic acid biosynthesis glycosyltransferase